MCAGLTIDDVDDKRYKILEMLLQLILLCRNDHTSLHTI